MTLRTVLAVVSIVLSVILGLVLARSGGGASAARTGRPQIGLSLDTLKEARWKADSDLFSARCNELGADVQVHSANSDDTAQMNQVQTLITNDVDVLVIVPHDGTAMAAAVRAAHEAKIPVIAYDRIIRDCDLDLYLSFDNVKVGEYQAKYLLDHLPSPGKGRIVRIYGPPTDNNAKMFKAGQDNILKPYIERGDIKVVHEDWAENWTPENAKRITQAAITAQGKFDAILASNDGTAGGAIQALSEENLAGKVLVTGQDAELVACQRIVNGTQAMTIYKPLKRLANSAAEVSVKMANRGVVVANDVVNNGKVDVPSVLGEVITVTKDNMIDTVIKDGFQTYEDVYRDVPPNARPPKP
jgi:D-xylose transport system substrate-binding protein